MLVPCVHVCYHLCPHISYILITQLLAQCLLKKALVQVLSHWKGGVLSILFKVLVILSNVNGTGTTYKVLFFLSTNSCALYFINFVWREGEGNKSFTSLHQKNNAECRGSHIPEGLTEKDAAETAVALVFSAFSRHSTIAVPY